MIRDNQLTQNGDTSLLYGGAMLIDNSDVTIFNTTFTNNTAIHGAAMAFRCTSMALCSLNTTENRFVENTAEKEGGAIYYDYNRPEISSNIFVDNQAQYGSDIASYPVKIVNNGSRTDSMSISNIGSGIQYDDTITLALLDYDNQTMVLNDQDSITINPSDFSQSSIFGTNYGLLTDGVTSFSGLTFTNQPGAMNVPFVASSKAIDTDKINNVFGSQISDNIIDISFRWCQPGEIDDQNGTCTQ